MLGWLLFVFYLRDEAWVVGVLGGYDEFLGHLSLNLVWVFD